jgi:hypothetical protein
MSDLSDIAQNQPSVWRAIFKTYWSYKMTQISLDFLRIASTTTGVACFTENPRSRLMWAHYADQFRGVVIAFESCHPFFSKIPLQKVRYAHRRLRLPNFFKQSRRSPIAVRMSGRRRYQYVSFLAGMERFALSKNVEFRYEREWRIFRLLAQCRKRLNGHYFRQIPRSCIKEVIFGPRCNISIQKAIALCVRTSTPKAKLSILSLDAAGYHFLKLSYRDASKRGASMTSHG